MKTIEDLLIARGELGRIYTGMTSLYLWRALPKPPGDHVLYPDFEARTLPNGRTRFPDVETREINGVLHVIADLGRGVSLFDREGTFGYQKWDYFVIPQGTTIPHGLIIVKDNFNDRFKATHYSISPNKTLPKEEYCRLLDELAQNALARKRAIG